MNVTRKDEQSLFAIVMKNASLDFGGGAGVFDLNFSLPQGSILGMIGPSGCGKTTTIAGVILNVLLATASVGIGFLISAVSRTNSQANQLTMLALFLPITGFAWPAWIIALLIPMTSAIDGFQHLMLAGTSTTTGPWNLLGVVALLSYDLVSFVMRLQ